MKKCYKPLSIEIYRLEDSVLMLSGVDNNDKLETTFGYDDSGWL